MKDLANFINDQLSRWPLACGNFRALRHVALKEMTVGGLNVKAQFNPARIASSAAKTDSESIARRPCFLCPENRYEEQISLRFDGRKGKWYDILVNPFPVFPDHLVIASGTHTEQSIWKRFVDMLDLSRACRNFIFFYNGPKCGASAPDHLHFQATRRGMMPLENDVDSLLDSVPHAGEASIVRNGGTVGETVVSESPAAESGPLEYLTSIQDADLFHYRKFTTGIFVLRGRTEKSTARLFYRLLDCAPLPEGDREPRFNLFTYYKSGEYRCIVVFRTQHRSHHYFSTGEDHLTMSPGCVDMAGLFIVPVREDFDKLGPELLGSMLSEVSVSAEEDGRICSRLTRGQRLLSVGIMSGSEIVFEIRTDGAGKRRAVYADGKIEYDGALYDELYFEAKTPSTMFAEPTFILHGVTIGKGFHWQRTESQRFAGALKIIVEDGALTAVNVVGVEDYLLSVISSEMNAAAPLELLKAHAVISRSWVAARLERKGGPGEDVSRRVEPLTPSSPGSEVSTCPTGPERSGSGTSVLTGNSSTLSSPDHVSDGRSVPPGPETVYAADGPASVSSSGPGSEIVEGTRITCWYGTSQHANYDVCADDHCQRYQGVTRAVGRNVKAAIDATWGEVLTCGGEICDTRFSKCCGGMTELYSSCWEDRDLPYLRALPDTPGHLPGRAFCDTSDREILSSVLNDYDLETPDFYRWSVVYGREEISALIRKKTGVDIGTLAAMEPLSTGPSGRITELLLRGDKAAVAVSKELEIRKVLSETHLKSSAFEPVYLDVNGEQADPSGNWTELLLRGKGWGHGVGLCQIGAAVMAAQGYSYRQILQHYYPDTSL